MSLDVSVLDGDAEKFKMMSHLKKDEKSAFHCAQINKRTPSHKPLQCLAAEMHSGSTLFDMLPRTRRPTVSPLRGA